MTTGFDARPGATRAALRWLSAVGALALVSAVPAQAQEAQAKDASATVQSGPDTPPATAADVTAPPAVGSATGYGISVGGISLNPSISNELMTAFRRPVDVELRDATVRQAAVTISNATGIAITVDESVSKETRLTVEAHRIPLATLLEAIGRQAEIMIAPDARANPVRGVALTRPAFLKVNGEDRSFGKEPTAPWSGDWGIPPTARLGIPVFPTAMDMGITQPYLANLANPPAAMPALVGEGWTPGPATPLTIASVGNDLVVVAESGFGEGGTPGAWLTLYRLQKDGKAMTRLSSTFHAYHSVRFGAPTGAAPAIIPPSPTAPTSRGEATPVPSPAPSQP